MPRKTVDVEEDVKMVRVRVLAGRKGYFGDQLRREGDVFDMPENMLPSTEEGWRDCWLELAKPGTRRTIPGAMSALERQISQQRAYQQTQNEDSADVI